MNDQERIAKLEKACEQMWGEISTIYLMLPKGSPIEADVKRAVMKIDRQVRALGIKGFAPPRVQQVDEDCAELREIADWFDQAGKRDNATFLRAVATRHEVVYGAWVTAHEREKSSQSNSEPK